MSTTPQNSAPEASSSLPVQDTRPTETRHLQRGPLGFAKVIYQLFSKVEPRAAPSPNKTKHIRLISIRVSHFCEKARWVLDMLDENDKSPYYYTEDCHPPGFHSFESVGASKDNGSATPMIVLPCNNGDDDEVLYKSNIIIERLCPELYPTEHKDDIKAMEQDLGDRLGATVRCYAYHNLLCPKYYSALVTMATPDCATVERVLFDKMLPHGLAAGIRKSLGVNTEAAARSKQALVELFEELSVKLEKVDYLVGNQFTAADLTFAALASPLIRPPEMSNFQCFVEALPEDVLALSQQLRETRAGQHVLKLYTKHRFVGENRKVVVKTGNRNRFPF